jgi:hypothetical protein
VRRAVRAVARLVKWLLVVAVLAVPGTATVQASTETHYRVVFTGSALWRVTYESGTAYSAGGAKTVYTARITWTFVFPFQLYDGVPNGSPLPGAGSSLHGGWTSVVGSGGPPVQTGCGRTTFRYAPDEAGGYLPISLTGRGQRVGFKLPVPFLVGDVAWGGRCTNPFTNPGTYTWTSKCPEATTLRDYASILWLAHSGPPAHESASASVTCDTGHAYDLISFPIVDNHLHWSGTVTVTHLSS